jgi:sterol desaturase/sphingolipid hydroxylase (fatty acid hydroxylase superfamily)
MKLFGPTAFALFRVTLGLYLLIHFLRIYSVSPELFSNQGVVKDATILPSYGKLPIFLLSYDSPEIVQLFVGSLIFSSILLTIGISRRLNALWLYYGWASLLNRNPLISNPSIGYIGWILLACSTIPKGERLGFLLSEKQRKDEKKNWELPDPLYYGMWIIMGISYTASVLHKLQCPDWVNGTALHYVLDGPLARNNLLVRGILSDIRFIKIMTWGSLFLELSCLFLGTLYRTRKYYWLMFMGFHFGILATVNFSDLTFGMIMAHLFTFDPQWFKFTEDFIIKYDMKGKVSKFETSHADEFNRKPIVQNIKDELERSSIGIDKFNSLTWIIYSIVIVLVCITINSKNGLYSSLVRLTRLTVDMYWGFGFLVIILGFLMILERIYPDQKLQKVEGWWKWVVIINIFQLFAVILASFTWENWLQNTSYFTSKTGFHLRDYVSPFTGGLIAYIINQWLFYHWHKARHEVYALWILFHQFHHSPSRIETITSFYKHPLEIVADSQIMAILLYSVLGLTNESSIWLSIFSGVGEYVYHMNIKTPRLLGYFFQRPESHRVHHRKMSRLRCPNYSDFPLWDILGGTFENPERMNEPAGFTSDKEIKRIDMLLFKDVISSVYQDIFCDFKKFKKVIIRYFWYFLVVWGTLNASAFIAHFEGVRDISFATVSSPLPLVFSAYNGYETFATSFNVTIEYLNSTIFKTPLDSNRYNLLSGAYNRRNIYGAVFSHGPFFDKDNLIKIRQSVLNYAVCDPGSIIKDFNLHGNVSKMYVDVFYRPESNRKVGQLYIEC